MSTKLRIKLGTFELEFEGEDKFAKADLFELMDKVHSLAAIMPKDSGEDDDDTQADDDKTNSPRVKGDWSTSKIAQKIGGKTGTELAIAAIAHICIVNKNKLAKRDQILNEMRSAASFFRDSYRSNLTSTLRALVKSGKVHENGTNNFALSDDVISTIQAQLAK